MLTIQKAAKIHSEMDRIFKDGESSFLSDANIQKTHKICKYMDSINSQSTLFIKEHIENFIQSLKIDDTEVIGYKSKKHETYYCTHYYTKYYIDTEKIFELATPAYFGKGSETVYDENIRKAFEVTADRITIEEKSENFFKENFYYNFEKDLVPPGKKFVCKLYKMHIYKEGGKFERHKDTIHTPNHYATFIVSIPTEFKGGKLLLYENKGDEKPIAECDFKYYNAVIFLTDVEHEITLVESGTRIVLQYDVYLEDKEEDKEDNYEEDEDRNDSECLYQKSKKEYLATENYVNNLKTEAETNILQEVIDFKEKHPKDEVSFLLSREYPLTVDLECLKAGDRKLYDILSTKYVINLGYVVNNFRSNYECEFDYDDREQLKVMNYSDTENFLNYVNGEEKFENKKNTHIFVSGGSFHVLKSIDYIEHTGNEAAPAEYSYVSLVLNIKNKV